MSVDRRKYSLRFKAECFRDVPGGSPGLSYESDRGWPDDTTLQHMIDSAKKSVGTCGKCIGDGCQTWALAHATLDQMREFVSNGQGLLTTSKDQSE
jgi:hypothetical protein